MSTTQTMSAAIAGVQTQLAAQAPADILSVFTNEQRALGERGMPPGVAVAGTRMPDANLLDVDGNPTTLAQVLAGAPAVVVFYRGAWCPFCNMALHVYQAELVPALTAKHIPLIAISPQKPDGSLAMRDKHDLTFTVVSDPGNHLARTLGILTTNSDAAQGAQAQIGVNVAASNADGTNELPIPTVAIVDATATIRWIDVHPNYATRTEPSAIIDAVNAVL